MRTVATPLFPGSQTHWRRCCCLMETEHWKDQLQIVTPLLFVPDGRNFGCTVNNVDIWMSDSERRHAVSQYLNKALKENKVGSDAVEAWDAKWARAFPAVVEFLACTVGPDGKPRRGATLTLFAAGGSWKLSLKDRDAKRTWWGEGDVIEAALSDLDQKLGGRGGQLKHDAK